MGSLPDHMVEADLNGTGVLVDITEYADVTGHEWGRTDWTSDTPNVGTLTLSLDNSDGRFSPGNTTTYAVGCKRGVQVLHTIGDRVRRFRMGTPEVAFPSGGSGDSVVAVTCTDALQYLADYKMRPMVDEEVLIRKYRAGATPIAYWPLSESGTGSDVECQDISGNGHPPISVLALSDDAESNAFGWTSGVGPVGDNRGCLQLWGSASAAAIPYTARLYCDQITLAADQSFKGTDEIGGATTIAGLSWWVNVSSVYGTPSTDGTSGGPFVFLGGLRGMETWLLWRPADSGLFLLIDGEVAPVDDGSFLGTNPTMTRGQTHHIAMTVRNFDAADARHVTVQIDGNTPRAHRRDWLGSNRVPTGLRFGSGPTIDRIISGATGSSTTVYGFAGSIANAALWPADALGIDIDIPQIDGVDAYHLRQADSIYNTGIGGPTETVEQRLARLQSYLTVDSVPAAVITPEGTSRPGARIKQQDTDGKDMLTVVGEVLRGEGAALSTSFDTSTDPDSDVVVPWLYSRQRNDSEFTVHAEADGLGVPNLTADSSTAAINVDVTNPRITVTWADPDQPAEWAGTSASLTAVLLDTAQMLALAQERSWQGRLSGLRPAEITVEAATAGNDLTDDLVAARPGQRITISGLPSTVLSVASVDAYVIGVAETHTDVTSTFTLRLGPLDGYVPGHVKPASPSAPTGRYRASAVGMVVRTAMTSSTTSCQVGTLTTDSLPMFSTASGDYPLDIIVGSEVMTVSAAPSAATTSGSYQVQTLTVTRGVSPSTARAHSVGDEVQLYLPAAVIY